VQTVKIKKVWFGWRLLTRRLLVKKLRQMRLDDRMRAHWRRHQFIRSRRAYHTINPCDMNALREPGCRREHNIKWQELSLVDTYNG
jgi:hypothetical protein